MADKRNTGPDAPSLAARLDAWTRAFLSLPAALVLLGLPAAGCAGDEHDPAPPLGTAAAALAGADHGAVGGPVGLVSTQHAKLLPADGAPGANFGVSVAISGDMAVIGAEYDDDLGAASGSAYVFVKSGAAWVQQAKLLAADGAASAHFGRSVAISGDTIVVGAYGDDELAGWSGAAYVFVKSGAAWTQQAKLLASDGASGDQLGLSVAVSGDTAVVGGNGDDDMGSSSGSAYVFVRSGAVWTQQAKLLAADGAADDWFGWTTAVSGDTAVVGALYDDDEGSSSGSAYVFVRSGAAWTQQAKLVASDGYANDWFSHALDIDGDTLLVGAYGHDDTAQNAGSAYVFVRSGAAWTQQAQLLAGDGTANGGFGYSVAVRGDAALIGAALDDHLGNDAGSAYSFARSGGVWTEQAKLVAADWAADDHFGFSVALSGDTAVIGARQDDDAGGESGSAYIFGAPLSQNGVACSDGAACLSGFCVDGVCCDTACGGGSPSDCQACSTAAGAAMDGACAPLQASTVCRAAAGACDEAEACDGADPLCPPDALVPQGTVCRAAADVCDEAEACDGADPLCPPDALVPQGTVCRAAADVCDAEEACTGQSPDCPADTLAAPGTECRFSSGECDSAEVCDGLAAGCPEDGHVPDGEPCSGGSCTEGTCEPGSGGAGGGGGSGTGGTGGAGGEAGGGTGGGGGGTGGAGGEAAGTGGNGAAGAAGDPGDEGGCACRAASASSPAGTPSGAMAGLLILALAAIRRARR